MLGGSLSAQARYSQYVRKFEVAARHGSVEVDQTICVRGDAAQCARDRPVLDGGRPGRHFSTGRGARLRSATRVPRVSPLPQHRHVRLSLPLCYISNYLGKLLLLLFFLVYYYYNAATCSACITSVQLLIILNTFCSFFEISLFLIDASSSPLILFLLVRLINILFYYILFYSIQHFSSYNLL